MFRLESFEQLLKTFNALDEEGKAKALKSMGSIKDKPASEGES